jgi:hypothetical protein
MTLDIAYGSRQSLVIPRFCTCTLGWPGIALVLVGGGGRLQRHTNGHVAESTRTKVL